MESQLPGVDLVQQLLDIFNTVSEPIGNAYVWILLILWAEGFVSRHKKDKQTARQDRQDRQDNSNEFSQFDEFDKKHSNSLDDYIAMTSSAVGLVSSASLSVFFLTDKDTVLGISMIVLSIIVGTIFSYRVVSILGNAPNAKPLIVFAVTAGVIIAVLTCIVSAVVTFLVGLFKPVPYSRIIVVSLSSAAMLCLLHFSNALIGSVVSRFRLYKYLREHEQEFGYKKAHQLAFESVKRANAPRYVKRCNNSFEEIAQRCALSLVLTLIVGFSMIAYGTTAPVIRLFPSTVRSVDDNGMYYLRRTFVDTIGRVREYEELGVMFYKPTRIELKYDFFGSLAEISIDTYDDRVVDSLSYRYGRKFLPSFEMTRLAILDEWLGDDRRTEISVCLHTSIIKNYLPINQVQHYSNDEKLMAIDFYDDDFNYDGGLELCRDSRGKMCKAIVRDRDGVPNNIQYYSDEGIVLREDIYDDEALSNYRVFYSSDDGLASYKTYTAQGNQTGAGGHLNPSDYYNPEYGVKKLS